MKSIYIILIALFTVNVSAFAQAKVKDQATIKVPGLHCDLDKERIERQIFKIDGLIKYKVDVKRKTVFVAWLTDRTNLATLRVEIANVGYDADNEKAEETMRKRLPAACRVEPIVVPVKQVQPAPAVVPAKPEIKTTKPVVTTTKPVVTTTKPATTNTKPVVKPAKQEVKITPTKTRY